MTTNILLRMLHRVDSFLEDLHFEIWCFYYCAPVLHAIDRIGFFIADMMEYIEKGHVE